MTSAGRPSVFSTTCSGQRSIAARPRAAPSATCASASTTVRATGSVKHRAQPAASVAGRGEPDDLEVGVVAGREPLRVLAAPPVEGRPGPADRVLRVDPFPRVLAIAVPQLAAGDGPRHGAADHLRHDPRSRVVQPRDGGGARQHQVPYCGVVAVDHPSVGGHDVGDTAAELVLGHRRPARLPVDGVELDERHVEARRESPTEGRLAGTRRADHRDAHDPTVGKDAGMRFGLQIPNFTLGVPDDRLFEEVAGIATTAEESGYDSVWVMDHFYQLPPLGGPAQPMLEAYTLLGALGARTERVRLGTLVTGVTYRNPALLAKIITTLDVITRGRAILGIGAAWHDVEHQGLCVAFPPAGERLDRLEEAVQICRAMFREERPTFQGRHYRIEEARNVPRPVQAGGPPIMIGGGGEKRTLRLVAQYADMCNVTGDVDGIRHK